jgi:TPR repeat protein
VPQDYAEAVRWFRKAGEQGDATAQFNLGLMCQRGQGVPRDYVQAHMWLNLAASRASGDDQKKYADQRDFIAGKMTAQQIAEAQRLAREWKPVTAK